MRILLVWMVAYLVSLPAVAQRKLEKFSKADDLKEVTIPGPVSGTVRARVVIDQSGKVIDVDCKANNFSLEVLCHSIISKWKFEKGERQILSITFNFTTKYAQ